MDQHAGDVAEVGADRVRSQVTLGDQVTLVVGQRGGERLRQRLFGHLGLIGLVHPIRLGNHRRLTPEARRRKAWHGPAAGRW